MFRLSLNSHRKVFENKKYWKSINFGQNQSVKSKLYDRLTSFNSIWNDFVHNAHNLVQKMANLAFFKPPELCNFNEI